MNIPIAFSRQRPASVPLDRVCRARSAPLDRVCRKTAMQSEKRPVGSCREETAKQASSGRIRPVLHALIGLCVALGALTTGARASDAIYFGNADSESSHSFSGPMSAVITGGLNQPARQLLPYDPAQLTGGAATFTMACDPVQQNYFTVKLWGSDIGSDNEGRLYLFIKDPVTQTFEMDGYQHEGDVDCLNVAPDEAWFPSLFFYQTVPIPLAMTQGQTTVTLQIQSTGRIFAYGNTYSDSTQGIPYQRALHAPTRGIYAGYTHTDTFLSPPVGEIQGGAITPAVRPGPDSSVLASLKSHVNNGLSNLLNSTSAITDPVAVNDLAKAYNISWTVCYHNATALNKIVGGMDALAQSYNSGATAPGGWTVLGPAGEAVFRTSAALSSAGVLDQSISTGIVGDPTDTRRLAWANALQISRDFLRTHRNSLSVQGMIVDENLYLSNRGMESLHSASAFSEAQALAYVYQAVGMPGYPWLGSDLTTGGSALTYGSNFYQVSPKGINKDMGLDGGYGEVYMTNVPDLINVSGDAALAQRYRTMVQARSLFRYPLPDADGYRAMRIESVTGWRNDDYPWEVGYADRSSAGLGLISATALQDTYSIGLSQQFVSDDNQYFNALSGSLSDGSSGTLSNQLDVPDQYALLTAQPVSSARLPMTDGQPDFAWADEDVQAVVVKHGDDRLYVNLYYRAHYAINSLVRVHHITPTIDRIATFFAQPRFSYSGILYSVPDYTDRPYGDVFPWGGTAGTVHQAWAGTRRPAPTQPADVLVKPATGTDDPYAGKASFVQCRYGHYLIGMNSTSNQAFRLTIPVGETSAPDLISGQTYDLTQPVNVGPMSTVVLYLASQTDAAPLPSAPVVLSAIGSNGSADVAWDTAAGATSYNVKRATASGGPYTMVAANIAATSYIDTGLLPNTNYFYVVTGVNANGESAAATEMPITTVAAQAGLPSPWVDTDVGAVGSAGRAAYSGGTFTVTGSGVDIWSAADGFNFVYQPLLRDGTVVARVASQQNTNPYAKSGVMIRVSLAPNSAFADIVVTPSQGILFDTRSGSGSLSETKLTGVVAPYWVKIVRSGSTLTGYASPDGGTWTQVGQTTLGGPPDIVYAGLAVTAHDNTKSNTSTFDNVAMTQSASGTLNAVSQPVFAPNGGTFVGSTAVSLSDATAGAVLYYTTDGSTPSTSSTRYINSFTISGSETIKAVAGAPGYANSPVSLAVFTITAARPTLSGLSPSTTTAGGPAFTLTVNGANFVSGSIVKWNGNSQKTNFVSSTTLTAAIPASLIASTGMAQVTVTTPKVATTTALPFTITAGVMKPVITSLSPASKKAGSGAFMLTVTGTGFLSNSIVKWNGASQKTTFVSGTTLTAAIPASLVKTAGTVSVTVTTPQVATSPAKSFPVTP